MHAKRKAKPRRRVEKLTKAMEILEDGPIIANNNLAEKVHEVVGYQSTRKRFGELDRNQPRWPSPLRGGRCVCILRYF